MIGEWLVFGLLMFSLLLLAATLFLEGESS